MPEFINNTNAEEIEQSAILKGAAVANAITEDLVKRVENLKAKGIEPCLAILMVGEKTEDLSYKAGLLKRFAKCNIKVNEINLPGNATKEEILAVINKVNKDSRVHGLLMFRPLADKAAEEAAGLAIDPAKDVDCMSPQSLAYVFTGKGKGFAPCTPEAVMEMLAFYGIELEGRNVALIGRSNVVGKPLAMLLQQKNATVTMCHTKTVGLPIICSRADIIVAAAGKAKMIKPNYLSEGQFIVDVGINVDSEGKLCGDVDFNAANGIAAGITPVPGGVGAVTSSVLAKHVVIAAENSLEE